MSERASVLSDQVQLFAMSFLLPGLVPLFAFASINPAVASWFGNASSAPTFAGAFFVVIGAIAIGFLINALRFTFYERTYFGFCLVEPSKPFDMNQRDHLESAYMDHLRRSFYFHYLAYSNLSVAIPAAALIWIAGRQLRANDAGAITLSSWAIVALLAITILITALLGVAGCESIRRYNMRRGELLDFKKPPAA